jgi:hypothetical protein
MGALHSLDERVRRELFQDRMSFSALRRLLSRTVQVYPRILQRVREHVGARGAFWWLASVTAIAFSERRKARILPEGEIHNEESARAFARFVELYKHQNGANSHR